MHILGQMNAYHCGRLVRVAAVDGIQNGKMLLGGSEDGLLLDGIVRIGGEIPRPGGMLLQGGERLGKKEGTGVGMKEATSSLLTEVCDEFIFYEDITRGAGVPDFTAKVPKERHACYQLLFETIDALQRESDSFILASRLKDTMRRKRPQFSEASYGYRSFTALLLEASKLGFIEIHQDPKSGTAVVDGFCE